MRISKQFLWMMTTGQQRSYQKEHSAYMKMGCPINVSSYPCPYRTNGTSSYIDSLDLSDISDLEDHFLTTSDDEDLQGLEEVPY